MIKKTKKVKRKIVKSKNSKRSLKSTPKKIVKKKDKKNVKRTSIIRKKRKKIKMEDIYKIINRVQIDKKKITFVVLPNDDSVVENIVKDAMLEYNKTIMKTQTVYTVYPNFNEDHASQIQIEYLDDEIAEEGQIF